MSLTDKIIAWTLFGLIASGVGAFLIWQFWAWLDRVGYRRRWHAGEKRHARRTAELGPDANKCVIRKELL